MNNPLEEVLEKIFRDDKIKYYHPADAIFNDQYIRWDYFQNRRGEIVISFGSNDGETEVNVFKDAEKLKQFIELAIY